MFNFTLKNITRKNSFKQNLVVVELKYKLLKKGKGKSNKEERAKIFAKRFPKINCQFMNPDFKNPSIGLED